MHECQRLLNGETSQTGPMRASLTEVVDVVTLAPALPETTEASSEAREAAQMDTAELENLLMAMARRTALVETMVMRKLELALQERPREQTTKNAGKQ